MVHVAEHVFSSHLRIFEEISHFLYPFLNQVVVLLFFFFEWENFCDLEISQAIYLHFMYMYDIQYNKIHSLWENCKYTHYNLILLTFPFPFLPSPLTLFPDPFYRYLKVLSWWCNTISTLSHYEQEFYNIFLLSSSWIM